MCIQKLKTTLYRVVAVILLLVFVMPLNIALASEPHSEPEENDIQGIEADLDSDTTLSPDATLVLEDSEADDSSEVLPFASSSSPDPVSALYVRGKIISKVPGDDNILDITDYVPTLYPSGNSLWFNDGSGVRHVIVTYDNGGAIRHHRDTVEITVRREGQGTTGGYTYVDGVKRAIPGSGKVLSAYPNKFVQDMTYQFNYRYADPDAPYTIFTAGHIGITDPHSSTAYTRFETNVYIYWDFSDRAPAPKVYFSYDAASGQMVLSGVDSSMEYRPKNASSSSWKPCSDEPMYFDGTTGKDTLYFVRYAAVGDGDPSQVKEIVLPAKRSAPKVSYSSSTEMINSLTTQMEVRIDDGPYEAVTGTSLSMSDVINTIPDGSTMKVYVRYKATSKAQASEAATFTLRPRNQAPSGLTLNPVTLTLNGCTTAMEYKGEKDTSWRSISSTSVSLESYAKGDGPATVLVRFKSTKDNAASQPVEIVIPQLAAGPAGHLDYANEVITSLDNGSYQYSTNGTSWTGITVSDGQWNISKLITSSAKTLYLRKAATSTSPITAAVTFALPGRLSAPSAPKFVYNSSNYPGKAVLSGLSAGIQYKKSTDTVWTDVTSSADIPFDIPTASVSYNIRIKATDQSFTSSSKTITLSTAGSAPSCSYNSTTEKITSLSTRMEMKVGNGAYTDVTSTTFLTTELIDGLSRGNTITITVRFKATETAPASLEKVFTLYPRGEKPANLVYDTGTNSINGCSSAMEYRLETSTSWTGLSNKALSLQSYAKPDRDVKVYIRTKATTTAAASLPVEFTIPQMLNGPVGTVEFLTESISGLENGTYQYSTNASSWYSITVTNGKWDISSLISTSSKTLYLRKAATSTTPITFYTTFKIPARPSAPSTPAFVYNDANYPGKAVLNGLNAGMQYKKSTDTEWTNVPSDVGIVFDIPATSVTYYVRNKATEQAFISSNKSITLSKAGSAPSCSYSSTTEKITSLSTRMEMKIGNGAYEDVTATTFSTTELIDNITKGSTLTIAIRYKATATAPASLEKVFTLYPRGEKPTNLVYDFGANSLKGCNSTMEYRLDTATSWTGLSSSALILQSYAKTDRNVKVYVRTKPTTTAAASLPVEFTIPQMLEGPIGTIEFLTESIAGLENGTYQYSTNASSWTTITVTNGKWDISTLVSTSSRTLYLRKAATSTTPITAYTTFKVPAKPSAPSTPVFVYNDANHSGKAILSGVTTGMQYRKSTDTVWTDVPSDSGIVFDIPTASVTYYVRNRTTAQTFSSSYKSITLLKPGTAPSCSYNSKTEVVSSLSTRMEMKVGNGAYTDVTATTFSTADLLNSLPAGTSTTISVRYKATATAPASLEKVLTINARPISAASDETSDELIDFEHPSELIEEEDISEPVKDLNDNEESTKEGVDGTEDSTELFERT